MLMDDKRRCVAAQMTPGERTQRLVCMRHATRGVLLRLSHGPAVGLRLELSPVESQ